MENPFEQTVLPLTSVNNRRETELTSDVLCYTNQIVNVVFIGNPAISNNFVLIDTGMPHAEQDIIAAAERRFGPHARASAIILTHGHFDHVGAIAPLLNHWDCPVYAHEDEIPFLTGQADYPPGDPSVGGGLVSRMSPLFPRRGIRLNGHIYPLPIDHTVPYLAEWQWIHTPGHTPGHISLYRQADNTLIAGDAITTVEQESLLEVFIQKKELHGPPSYFTTDWQAAEESVYRLSMLDIRNLVTGHGLPIFGTAVQEAVRQLAERFRRTEIPVSLREQ